MSIRAFFRKHFGWGQPNSVSIFAAIVSLKDMIEACKAKDAALFADLSELPVPEFARRWKLAHPEDFPLGGDTLVGRDAIKL